MKALRILTSIVIVCTVIEVGLADDAELRAGWLPVSEMMFIGPEGVEVSLNSDLTSVIAGMEGRVEVAVVERANRVFDVYRWRGIDIYTRPDHSTPIIIEVTRPEFTGPKEVTVGWSKRCAVSELGAPWFIADSELTWIHSFMDETWYFVLTFQGDQAVAMKLHRLD